MKNIEHICALLAGKTERENVDVDHLDKPVTLDEETDLFWKVNSSKNIAKCVFNKDPVVYDKYAGRAELFGPNYSLKLKNVQHSDSGDYTALVVSQREQSVAEYKVIVQVTPVDLTVESVSKTSDSCNLTVTCSTVDFNISSSFRCDGKICSHAEEKDLKATKEFSSLSVYLQQDTIFCNHSNQVSWNQTMKVLKSYFVFSVGLIIMVIAVISVHIMEKIKK
uniref:Immunoglobulin subtype domain-containing protein n=1 Tax=Pundamilia nyererei TaxID=303518 RepID=A0A3B4EZ41_9CICH